MHTYAKITKDIGYAKRVIEQGRIVAFPTGTCYGLAVNALFGPALQRLRNIKKRPQEKTFTVFMDESLWDTYLDLKPEEEKMLHAYAHTALTLLVRPKEQLAHLAQDGLIGLRVIDNAIMKDFAHATLLPMTATSANISGQDPCTKAEEIEEALPSRDGMTYDLSLGCVLDGGELKQGVVSTIARLNAGNVEIIRQGALMLS